MYTLYLWWSNHKIHCFQAHRHPLAGRSEVVPSPPGYDLASLFVLEMNLPQHLLPPGFSGSLPVQENKQNVLKENRFVLHKHSDDIIRDKTFDLFKASLTTNTTQNVHIF